MSENVILHERRIQNEISYHASRAEAEKTTLERTPDALVKAYQHCNNWKTNRVECVMRYLTYHKPQHICDFGCGSGEMATRLGLMGYRVTGIDVSPELIDVAKARAKLDGVEDRVDFVLGDAAGNTMPKGKFDAVLVMSILHHLPLEEGLSTLESLLAPGGTVAIQEPVAYSKGLQKLRDLSPVEKDISPDERQLDAIQIDRIKERFEVEEIRHYHLLARLSRLMPRRVWEAASRIILPVDQALLRLPGLSYFAGVAVIRARKKP